MCLSKKNPMPLRQLNKYTELFHYAWTKEWGAGQDRPWEREPTRRLPASRRSGASRPGQVNPGEVLIKAVNRGKPKMLSGLDQKVRGQVQGLQAPMARMAHHRPRGTTSPRSDRGGERSNPVASPAREG